MKKALSLVLAVMMLLGCMTVTAFAEIDGEGTRDKPYLASKLVVGDVVKGNEFLKNDFTAQLLVQSSYGTTPIDAGNSYPIDHFSWYKVTNIQINEWQGRITSIIFTIEETEEPNPAPVPDKTGSSEITAKIEEADFNYTMVIPTTTTLTEEAHENVLLGGDGKVSIKDVKHPTDKYIVSYTVDLTDGDLTDDKGHTIVASYKYKQGQNDFAAIDGTTKVTVYENMTVTDSFVNVTADDTQWKAAPTGTYNATVVFNFDKVEMAKVTFRKDIYGLKYGIFNKDGVGISVVNVPIGTTWELDEEGKRTFTFSNNLVLHTNYDVSTCKVFTDLNDYTGTEEPTGTVTGDVLLGLQPVWD